GPHGDPERAGACAFRDRLRTGVAPAVGRVHGCRRGVLDGAESGNPHELQLDDGAAPGRARKARRQACALPSDRRGRHRGVTAMARPARQPALKVLAFNCSLKSAKDKEKSSTESLLQQLMDELEKHGATGTIVRAVDHNIKPGVKSDEGKGDDWPALRQRVINCDILVMATPIWLGQPSSVAKRVMERMDAFLDETDDKD